ncbi:MAG: hypothetical protein R2932_52495 [Caldilineaceae bacterium]
MLELLRPQATLLALDNLEQIAEAASLIATLLAECPTVTILATSRERLHLRAEQRYKVPPLDLNAAVELFVQRAQVVADDFLLTEDNRATIAAICTRLDCLPLALELCAAQIELFAPAQLLAQLQARPLDLLIDGAPRSATTTSHTAFGNSPQLCFVGCQTAIFRSLGVCAGGFDLAAAAAIADLPGSSEILRVPSGKSLVRAETLVDGELRFFLLETIREFAWEQLQGHGEEERARQRHYVFYLQYFRSVDEYLRGPKTAVWFARLQPDHDNLRAAIQ